MMPVFTFIGTGALGVITRMMELILAVIGPQMVVEGFGGAFKLAGEILPTVQHGKQNDPP